MARETEPLLARRPSSNTDQGAEAEDALLSGQSPPEDSSFFSRFSSAQWRRTRETLAFIWAFLATIGIIVLAVVLQHRSVHPPPGHHHHGDSSPSPPSTARDARPSGKRNLIFMVSDGMGPSSLSLTRSFNQLIQDAPFNETLVLDSLLAGQSRTRSSSSLVTDSAAGATAFSCGMKSYNGAISMLPDGSPCPSVMEAAKRAGYRTGVVVTTRVTDATPACFGSHVRRREMEDEIAGQMLGLDGLGGEKGKRSMDIILGGGRCHFLPFSQEGSCREDDRDIVAQAKDDGWSWADSREDFDGLQSGSAVKLPLLGLFAGGDIPFELDRRSMASTYPSLDEMAQTALRALKHATADSEHGFFLMIEGSRIDHAGHINDPAAQVHEVLAYDATVRAVLDFIAAEDSSVPTLMVATSDHETGGLAVARQPRHFEYPHYRWFPSVLANATRSAEWTAHEFHRHLAQQSSPSQAAENSDKENLGKYVRDLVTANLGFKPTASEVDAVIERPVFAVWILADMISRRAQIGWSTHGHSAADVNIFTSAAVGSPLHDDEPGWSVAVRERLAGNRENTDVGRFLRWWLDVEGEFEDVGEELRKAHGGRAVAIDGEEVSPQEMRWSDMHRYFEGPEVSEYEKWAAGRDWS